MHSFRLRYIVLGLLIYLQNAFCRTCGSEFDDISSKSLIANVVFEGKVEGKLQNDNPDEVEYKVKFNVKKVFKGDLPKVHKRGKKYHPVVAGIFGYDGGKGCNTNVDTSSGSQTYIVFLSTSSLLNNSTQFYQISGLPEISNKKSRRDVRDILCTGSDCKGSQAKAPRGKISKKELTIQEGKRLQIKCRAVGHPKPKISWSKDGQPITKSKKYRFKSSKSGSRLRINKVTIEDTGHYTCHIRNVLGNITKQTVVKVDSKEDSVYTPQTPSHAIPCQLQTYCLNGGICYMLKDNNDMKFCRCAPRFIGERCETKDVYDFFGELMRPVYAFLVVHPQLDEDQGRDQRQFDRSMTVLGLVIGVLVLLAVCLTAYCLAKRKRKEFRKKQADKKRLQSATYTNGTHRPVSGTDDSHNEKVRPAVNIELKSSMFPSVLDTSTQTEAKWYDHMVVGNGVGRPPNYSPSTPPGSSINQPRARQNNPSVGGESIHSVSAPDVLGRPRLHAISATPDFDSHENRKPLANATVVSAVVESEPDYQTSVRSSPNQSQNSRTESEHGIPLPNNINDEDIIKKSDSNNLKSSNKLPVTEIGKQPNNNPNSTSKNNQTILDFDQQSDYDNQPSSDMEVNVESEADTQGLDDEGDLDSHLLQNEPQQDSADETDSESSATEEQALFHKLKTSRQSSIQSDLNEGGPFGGLFEKVPYTYSSNNQINYQQQPISPNGRNSNNTSPGQFAFNPYAVDEDLTGNNYFGNFGKPSTMPLRTSQNSNPFTGNDLILQNPLLYDPDPDATPL